MNAVGIDVSKGKSTVTIRKPGNVVLMAPRDSVGYLCPYRADPIP